MGGQLVLLPQAAIHPLNHQEVPLVIQTSRRHQEGGARTASLMASSSPPRFARHLREGRGMSD